jgi:hypothetical protein
VCSDPRLHCFWTSPGNIDNNNRERQLVVDFLSASVGVPAFYLGRDMNISHKGMGIDQTAYTALKTPGGDTCEVQRDGMGTR